ncbi:hypothetical protein GQ43DRAFT_434228 [Delitschia confertaspora ATCC 74209]|uniref:Uncharacterized protein n=1 Tax=Delitschia confertaspora ATCC 74209 TaxID=1513339 RepID=A0A9P4MPQ1_9PLEO|nr:hypothetical protein GQ43DRAFT_434228 [Delitschia confertaspora ATCC 74209]
MRFSVAAAAALVAGASAHYNQTAPAYVTEVVTAYTTYCPAPTEIVHGSETYTVTEATTLTITNCPCTITKPASPSTPVVVPTSAPVAPSSGAPVVPVVPSGAPAPYPNGTTPAYTPPAVGTGSATGAPPKFTGAANKAFAASGAGLAAVFGVVAYVL